MYYIIIRIMLVQTLFVEIWKKLGLTNMWKGNQIFWYFCFIVIYIFNFYLWCFLYINNLQYFQNSDEFFLNSIRKVIEIIQGREEKNRKLETVQLPDPVGEIFDTNRKIRNPKAKFIKHTIEKKKSRKRKKKAVWFKKIACG